MPHRDSNINDAGHADHGSLDPVTAKDAVKDEARADREEKSRNKFVFARCWFPCGHTTDSTRMGR